MEQNECETAPLIIKNFPKQLRKELKIKAATLEIPMKQLIIDIIQANLSKL